MTNRYLKPGIAVIAGMALLNTESHFLFVMGLGLIVWSIFLFIKAIRDPSASVDVKSLKEAISGFNYNHFYERSGIAIDQAKQEIHLISNGEHKVYPFSKIRRWETNIATGGLTTYTPNATTAMVATAGNFRQLRENKANTGLFVEVKDVDHPRWHIEFPAKDLQRQLERWMEILRQEVNESQ